MIHLFDSEIAEKYGINSAIILQNIGYWIKINEANNKNYFDGAYWTFNSRKAYKELFPYMSERQINTAFQKLIDDGLIITGNYNKLAYDRTLWYALTQKGKCILHFDIMDNDKMSNGNYQNVKPIPDINTNINANINTDINNIVDYLNSKLGTNYKSNGKKTRDYIIARLNEKFTVDDFKVVIDKKYNEWAKDEKMCKFLRPETLFGNKFESYLNSIDKKSKQDEFDEGLRRFLNGD